MKSKPLMNISILRILATIGVVFLHTCCTIILNPDLFSFSSKQETFFLICHHLFLWTVPVFFMISGMLLLSSDRNLTYKLVLRKYILRIFLALFIFGMMFGIIKSLINFHEIRILQILNYFISNDTFSHLWYLYSLIALYLLLPLLHNGLKNMKENDILILLVCLFVFNFIFPTFEAIIGIKIEFSISLPYAAFYFISGYYLKRVSKRYIFKDKINWLLIILCITAIIILICIRAHNNLTNSYTSPLVAIYSLAIFSCALEKETALRGRKQKIIWKVDRLCFGVYLIHPLFIQFSYRFLNFTPLSFKNYIFMTFVFATGFIVLSFIASFIMNLIPPLKKYVL